MLPLSGACPVNDRACVAPTCGTVEKLQTCFDCVKTVNHLKDKFADSGLIIEASVDPGK